jgi:DNA-binding NarL/FixJ family response regulator
VLTPAIEPLVVLRVPAGLSHTGGVSLPESQPAKTDAELEAEADALILANGGSQSEAPCYPQKYLIEREYTKRRGEVSLEEVYQQTTGIHRLEELHDIYWPEILTAAHDLRFTHRQIDMLQLCRYGFTLRELADEMCMPLTTTHRELQKAVTRLQNHPALGVWSVLIEVFVFGVPTIKTVLRRSREKKGDRNERSERGIKHSE